MECGQGSQVILEFWLSALSENSVYTQKAWWVPVPTSAINSLCDPREVLCCLRSLLLPLKWEGAMTRWSQRALQ